LGDLPRNDYDAVVAMLKAADPFRGLRVPGFDQYDPEQYHELRAMFGTSFTLVLDRNVFSRVIAMAKGDRVDPSDTYRTAAAIMAFSSMAECHHDGTVAIAEFADHHPEEEWRKEMDIFATAQNAGAQAYCDIALGRVSKLDWQQLRSDFEARSRADVFGLRLPTKEQLCGADLGVAYKLGLLMLDAYPSPPTHLQMAELLRWCYEEYLFLAPAIAYSGLALSPKRHRGMLKSIRSGDLARADAGVSNAAWDMALLRSWASQESHDKECVLLCSLDNALLECATDFKVPVPEAIDRLGCLRNRWRREWGDRDGSYLSDLYLRYVLAHDTDSSRAALRQKHKHSYWLGVVEDLKRQFAEKVGRVTVDTKGAF
jgi:hypothetical protein